LNGTVKVKSSKKLDRKTFQDLKEVIEKPSKIERRRETHPGYAYVAPKEITIQLTCRCNLRCKHCFQWNDNGYIKKDPNVVELDPGIMEKILKETHKEKSALYLWGGEPLFHKDWDTIARFIEKDLRRTVISTNGLLLEKKLESILRISTNLVTVISLDGFQEEHDAIRGHGTFNRTVENIKLLICLQRRQEYKGTITINCTLNDFIVPKLFEFVKYCEGLGIDRLIIGFPWYITKETARSMDDYFKTNLSWLTSLKRTSKPSWYSFNYHLALPVIEILHKQIKELNSRVWNIRVKLHPTIRLDEIKRIALGNGRLKEQHCLGLSSRISIWADGNTSFCSNFPEFEIGDINKQGMMEIWQSDRFRRVREIMNTKSMPISCQRCRQLSFNPT